MGIIVDSRIRVDMCRWGRRGGGPSGSGLSAVLDLPYPSVFR